MARRSTLRASDADREQVAERLRQATAEGRLAAEELEERLEATFAARTYGELDDVVADLPSQLAHRSGRPRPLASVRPAHLVALTLLAPVAFSLVLAAVVVVATVFSAWALLVAVAWFAFGYGRRYQGARYRHMAMHAYGRWPAAGRAGRPRPRPWV